MATSDRSYGKETNKRLHQIREAAWQRELDRELSNLFDSFLKWKAGELDAWELSDRIHRFHDGPNRELWKTYADSRRSQLEIPLAWALHRGVISPEEVPEEVLPEIERITGLWRDR